MNSRLKELYSVVERESCIRWIEEVFKDSVCNLNDEISFGFGIASLVFWGVAEIPQIITNYRNKSAVGVSLAFLSSWIIGDIFNLVGCILEPATLPTQLYTAVLYTTVTIVLALQCIYYNHLIQWRKRKHNEPNRVKEETEPLQPNLEDQRAQTNAPVEVPRRREFYVMSPRSLAGSDTPPTQYYIKARSGPPGFEHRTDSSSDEEEEEDEESDKSDSKSNIPTASNIAATLPRSIPRPVRYGTFLTASANLPHLGRAIRGVRGIEFPRRSLLQQEIHENAYGQWLGWFMAAIYMGGRVPQIWLNIKRGSVEGLDPFMFVFALIANATYVGSILARNSEWSAIKANMPWLLDAIVCVLLDLFIILQYIFYKYIKRDGREDAGEYYYVEAKETYF